MKKNLHHKDTKTQRNLKTSATLRLCGKIFILLFAVSLHAQDYEKVAPKVPEVEQKPMIETAPAKISVPDDEKIMIPELRAIVFLKDERELHRKGLKLEQSKIRDQKNFITVDDFPVLQNEDFKEKMQKYLGKPLNMKKLNELTETVVEYFREKNQPLVWVRLPEQNITTGVLQIIVTQARMGQVLVTGQKWIDPKEVERQLRLREADIVREDELLSDMDWMNRNPFRQVTAAYKAGKEPGTTDINLQVKDRFPARFYTGYENTGSDLTGIDRWYGGFNWGDAFGITNNLFNYQFTTSSDFDNLQAHAASDIFPLPWRHLVNLFGSYNTTEAGTNSPMELHGKSWNVGTRYVVPLPQINFEKNLWLEHNAQAGFDFKQSNNNLEFGGSLVTNTLTDIAQFIYNYNATLHDPYGFTNFGATLYQSPGGLTDNDKSSIYQTSRAGADANYVYGRIELSRQTDLPYDLTLFNLFVAQSSSANLLASEQLNLGGRDTIRGYDESETRGDQGWYIRNELRAPPLSISQLGDIKEINDRLTFLAFWDYGVVQNKHLLTGENANTELSSVGPGLRYTINPYLNASLDYGFQLLDSGLSSPHNSKLHLSITLSY